MSESSNKIQKRMTILMAGLMLVTVVAVCVTIWVLFFREPADNIILTPDYAPQQEEQNAEVIPDDTGEKMESPEGGGAVSLTYSNKVTIDLSDRLASLYFANPGKSNQDIVVQIAVQDTILLQSGTLSPGHQVKLLNLLENADEMLQPGGYDGKFIVLYYDPDSREKSMVNTEIPITIHVVE